MFTKLRRRLLWMNLIMISIVMMLAFVTIYYMTNSNINNAIKMELDRESTFGDLEAQLKQGQKEGDEIHPVADGFRPIPMEDLEDLNRIDDRGGQRTVTFSLNVDYSGDIITSNSMVERDNTFYEDILAQVVGMGETESQLVFDGSQWSFRVIDKGNFMRYSFVDMTTEQGVLDRLIITFIIVSLLTLIAIFIISHISTNRSIKPIRKAFEQQKQFISDASHELKTPLAVIGTNVEVLLGEDRSDEDKKWLNYIQSEVQRMSKLTNDLLYLTQVENVEKVESIELEVLVNDGIESMLLGLDAICYEKNIEFDYKLDPGISFKGHKEQFIQMVLILLDNAIKYTPKGGKIFFELKKTHHHIKINVKNTGHGIPVEDIPHLFDRFYRVDKARSRKDGSYGLGLSIVKAIVTQYQGKITCESVLDEETVFRIVLPS